MSTSFKKCKHLSKLVIIVIIPDSGEDFYLKNKVKVKPQSKSNDDNDHDNIVTLEYTACGQLYFFGYI